MLSSCVIACDCVAAGNSSVLTGYRHASPALERSSVHVHPVLERLRVGFLGYLSHAQPPAYLHDDLLLLLLCPFFAIDSTLKVSYTVLISRSCASRCSVGDR